MKLDIFDYLRKDVTPKESDLYSMLKNELNLNKRLLETPNHVNLQEKDLEIDMSVLLDTNNECNEYIWVVRQSGTHLYSEKNLFSNTSLEFTGFEYYKGYQRVIYKVTVEKRDLIRNKVYGKIEKLDTNKFTKKVLETASEHEYVLCKIITDDGSEPIVEYKGAKEDFKNSKIFKDTLNGNCDIIKKVYYLKYTNIMTSALN